MSFCVVNSLPLIAGVLNGSESNSFIEQRKKRKQSENQMIRRHLLVSEMAEIFTNNGLFPTKAIQAFLVQLSIRPFLPACYPRLGNFLLISPQPLFHLEIQYDNPYDLISRYHADKRASKK